MRVWRHDCDITRIGYVLSDARFDWLVGYMSVYQENLFQSRSKKPAFSFICRNIFEEYFIKAREDFFPCFHSLLLLLSLVGFCSLTIISVGFNYLCRFSFIFFMCVRACYVLVSQVCYCHAYTLQYSILNIGLLVKLC